MQAKLSLRKNFVVDTVSPWLFGGFLEHMGRSVYEGVYDPDSPLADNNGVRRDVVAALDELALTNVRYPGGNFTSGYHWEDGVGPQSQRPTVRELAWQSIETNQFGTDEFLRLCRELKWTPMLAANLGTGSPEEARNWVEYCNAPAGTKYSNMRVANGHEDPFAVPFWCLGNEMDGPWQLGHVPAGDYAIRAQQAAKMMKDVDPSIQTVACGSSFPSMPTYLEWDQTVLEHLGASADYISLHRYVGNTGGDTAEFLAVANSIDQQIEAVDACCKLVAAKQRLPKRAYLCFDEWNVWYKTRQPEHMDGQGKFAPPLIEEQYNVEDALVVAGFLLSFLRHADMVKVANIAQLVNVIGPILTRKDALLKQSIFYALQMVSQRKGGVSLRSHLDCPTYETVKRGTTSYLDHAATLNNDRLNLFLTNRSQTDALTVQVDTDLRLGTHSAQILTGANAADANTFDEPNRVISREFEGVQLDGRRATIELPPLSFAAVTLQAEPG